MAWLSRTEPSDDPTPHKALGLSLAVADPGANVVYLASPCQLTARSENPDCDVVYWTSKRYGEDVVAAMNQAVTHYAARAPGQPINLINRMTRRQGYHAGVVNLGSATANEHVRPPEIDKRVRRPFSYGS